MLSSTVTATVSSGNLVYFCCLLISQARSVFVRVQLRFLLFHWFSSYQLESCKERRSAQWLVAGPSVNIRNSHNGSFSTFNREPTIFDPLKSSLVTTANTSLCNFTNTLFINNNRRITNNQPVSEPQRPSGLYTLKPAWLKLLMHLCSLKLEFKVTCFVMCILCEDVSILLITVSQSNHLFRACLKTETSTRRQDAELWSSVRKRRSWGGFCKMKEKAPLYVWSFYLTWKKNFFFWVFPYHCEYKE